MFPTLQKIFDVRKNIYKSVFPPCSRPGRRRVCGSRGGRRTGTGDGGHAVDLVLHGVRALVRQRARHRGGGQAAAGTGTVQLISHRVVEGEEPTGLDTLHLGHIGSRYVRQLKMIIVRMILYLGCFKSHQSFLRSSQASEGICVSAGEPPGKRGLKVALSPPGDEASVRHLAPVARHQRAAPRG